MEIKILQGNHHLLPPSEITVVIDVIRAFTVAHYAFMSGVEKILLVGTVDEAFKLKEQLPDLLLAGEVKGLPIKGFDLDNSPTKLLKSKLKGRTLVQKTTNGVTATLHSLQAKELFVTGFSNARTTALYIKKMVANRKENIQIHLVASHESGDDDLACAQYMKGIIQSDECLTANEVIRRIQNSHVAAKFFDPSKPEFLAEDMNYCTRELDSSFVMKVRKDEIPVIERIANE